MRYSGALPPGDRVLIRGLRGKQELADRLERIPYIVISQPNADIPLCEVKQDRAKGKNTRMLHINLLIPFLGLPIRKQDVRGHETLQMAQAAMEM